MIKASEVYDKYHKAAKVEECLKDIESKIISVAESGETSIKYREFNFGGGHLYGGKPTQEQYEVIFKLQEAGYKAEVRLEHFQFVDIYLEISWSK